jgi:hypothetical protein
MNHEERRDESSLELSRRYALRAGFAVGRVGAISREDELLGWVENARVRAKMAMDSLEMALHDDGEMALVSSAAKDALRSLGRNALMAESAASRRQEQGVFRLADRTVSFVLGRPGEDDRPQSGWRGDGALRRFRGILMALVLGTWIAGSVGIYLSQYAVAMVMLLSGVGFDLVEGAIGRVRQLATEVDRWLACLLGHAIEFLAAGAIALDQYQQGHVVLGSFVLAAGTVSLFGSLVRISALQIGYRFEQSLPERAFRLAGILAYVTLSHAGADGLVQSLPSIILFGGYGMFETLKVLRKARRNPPSEGAFVFAFDEPGGVRSVNSWGFGKQEVTVRMDPGGLAVFTDD